MLLNLFNVSNHHSKKKKNENENERPVISTAETAAIEGNDGPSPSTDSGSQV